MSKRKTIGVVEMIEYANSQLRRYDDEATKEFKAGICVMIEKIMFKADCYSGFHFLNNNDCDINTLGHVSRKYYTPLFKKIIMNNKKVLAKYPNAVAQEFKTEFKEGYRGKGVPFFVIKENTDSIYTIGFGITEKEAWQVATAWLQNKPSKDPNYRGYLIKDATLEME